MRFLSIVMVAILAAGCVSGSSTGPPPATSAPPPIVSADTGSITGQVVNEELQAVPGADVAITGPAQAALQTDDAGKFTFNGLPAGPYTVIAQRLGYESGAKKVLVEVGAATEVGFTLASIALVGEPRREYSTYDGFIDRDTYTFAVGVYSPRSFTVNLSQGASALVVSMAWESSMPLFVRYMRVTPSYDGTTNTSTGRSPQTAVLEEIEVEKKKDKATVAYKPNFACGVDAMCFANNPDALVPQIAYQQRIKFYNTVFYNEVVPGGYTGLPE